MVRLAVVHGDLLAGLDGAQRVELDPPAMIASRALAWHEWFVKRIGSVDFDASIAVRGEISTIMMRCSCAARRRPSAQLIASPRISPIFSRARDHLRREHAVPVDLALADEDVELLVRLADDDGIGGVLGHQSRPVAVPSDATAGRSTRGAGVQPFLRCSTTTLV